MARRARSASSAVWGPGRRRRPLGQLHFQLGIVEDGSQRVHNPFLLPLVFDCQVEHHAAFGRALQLGLVSQADIGLRQERDHLHLEAWRSPERAEAPGRAARHGRHAGGHGWRGQGNRGQEQFRTGSKTAALTAVPA